MRKVLLAAALFTLPQSLLLVVSLRSLHQAQQARAEAITNYQRAIQLSDHATTTYQEATQLLKQAKHACE